MDKGVVTTSLRIAKETEGLCFFFLFFLSVRRQMAGQSGQVCVVLASECNHKNSGQSRT